MQEKVSLSARRVIKTLDDLYEFGPTIYYESISEASDGYRLFESVVEQIPLSQLNQALDRVRSLPNRKRITIKPYDLKLISEASDAEWSDLRTSYQLNQKMSSRATQLAQEVTSQVKSRFNGFEGCIGDEFKFDLLERQIHALIKSSTNRPDAFLAIANAIYEFGCFDVKVYDQATKALWDPTKTSYQEFAKKHSKLTAYIDHKPVKTPEQIHTWLLGVMDAGKC